jgi:hypothetical protein
LVADTPGIVGYGGNVTVGSPGDVVVGVEAADLTIIFAAGAAVVVSVFVDVVSAGAPAVSAETVSAAGVAACSVAVVDDFGLASVVGAAPVLGGVVPEPVPVWLLVVDRPVAVDAVVLDELVLVPADVLLPGTVVPEPPEALTVDVGPVPEPLFVGVVVGCAVVDVVDPVVEVVVPDVLEVPEADVDESVVVVDFDPVSESVEPDDWPSPVAAEAMPCPEATATPSPTAKVSPLALLARSGRLACFPRFVDAMTHSRLPRVAVHGTRNLGHDVFN